MVSELCFLAVILFILSALLGAPHGLRQDFCGAADSFSEGFVLYITARVMEFIDAVGFLEIIRQYSFEPTLIYFAYQRSEKVDWES